MVMMVGMLMMMMVMKDGGDYGGDVDDDIV